MSTTSTPRTSRYSGILDAAHLDTSILVIGAGGIGRPTALLLAQMGFTCIDIMDDDRVEPANMGTQGWRPDQLGHRKVHVLADDMTAANPDATIAACPHRFDFKTPLEGYRIVIIGTDNIPSRRTCYDRVLDTNSVELYLDARIAAEALDLYAYQPRTRQDLAPFYCTSIEYPEAPCTTRSTLYAGTAAASFIAAAVTRHLRELPLPEHVSVDLFDAPTPIPA